MSRLRPLRAAPLQHDPAVLRRHANAEAVRFLPAAGIRLVRALALHVSRCRGPGCPRPRKAARASPWPASSVDVVVNTPPRLGETSMLCGHVSGCQRCDGSTAESPARKRFNAGIAYTSTARPIPRVLQSPFPSRPGGQPTVGIGFLPKISTSCGKDCGKATRALAQRDTGQVNCLLF